jgi:ABC-type multidrug transport system fused ATPase/permease subunit/CRP-like cAMP-binding protein
VRAELEVTTPDGKRVVVELTSTTELGREGGGFVVDDPAISRRHLVLHLDGPTAEVEDLASANGTFVDGVRISEPRPLAVGTTIRVGDTRIVVRALGDVPVRPAAVPADAMATIAPTSAPQPAVSLRHLPARGFASIEGDGIVVSSVPGTVGAGVAPSVLDTAKRARKALAGFGSEPWGTTVTIALVDPFPDPADPTRLVAGGSVVDADTNTVWMAVTPESPPEDPHRPLAILFGTALPSAGDLDHLLEGYGLWLAGTSEPDPETVVGAPAALDALDPEMRGPLVASFVGYLIAREGEDVFRRLLTAPAGRVSEAWKEHYGRSSHALEAAWRADHEREPPNVGLLDFLRMSWRYLRPYRLRQLEVFGYMLLSLAFTVAYPFVTKRLFDEAIPSGEMSQVLSLLGFLGGAFAITLIAGLRQNYQSAWISGSVVRDLREEIFGKLQHLPDSWIARHPQGDVLSRMMNDVGRVQAGLSTAIDNGIFQLVSLVVSTVIMLQVNLWLGLLVLAGAPIVALVYRGMGAGARTRSLAVQEESGAVLSVASENYQANNVVKLFRLADYERARFRRTSDRLFRSQQRLSLFGGLFGVAVESIVTILRLAIIGIGAWLIFEGRFTLGGLVAFLGIMGEVLGPVTGLTTLGQSIQSSVGAIIRIDEVIEANPEPAGADLPALAPLRQEIRLEGVSFSYTPERRALDQVDVTIHAGTRVAFVGPSGSGKSTILRLLMRLYEPDEGRMTVDGVDVRERSLDSLRMQMGVVFQDSFLFDATLRENIALGSVGSTDAAVMAAAGAAEVDAFVGNLARGYDTLVGEGGRNLSGGQRQRVAIARALVGNPPILLLDEATSALDPGTERQISATLDRAGSGKTVIAITHRLTSVVGYDQIHVVDAGRIVESGTHEQLLARRGLYARLWAEQTGAEMPQAPPFDLEGVLSALPLFVDLDHDALADVAQRMGRVVLASGTVAAEGGQLVVIESGRGELVDARSGAVLRVMGSGDVFGLNALLGEPTGAQLKALEPMTLRTLAADDLDTLGTRHGEIDQARAGRSTSAAIPTGRALTRSTNASAVGRRSVVTATLSVAEVAAALAAARARQG